MDSVYDFLTATESVSFDVAVNANPGGTSGSDVVEYYNAALDHYFITDLLDDVRRSIAVASRDG